MTEIKISHTYNKEADVVLYKGDTLEMLRQLPDGLANLVVTSPPYNVGKPYETRLNIAEYVRQQSLIIKECVRVLSDTGSICWQVGNYVRNGQIIPIDILLFPVFSSLNLQLRNRIIWEFGHGLHATKRFSGRYEVILWFTKSDNYFFNLDEIRVPQKYPSKKYFKGPKKGQLSGNPLGKNPSDIWDIPNVKANHVEKTDHPCQFPIELIERLVLSMTKPGDWVLDPFMGVGTTAIASLMHSRKAIGAEIVEEYVNISLDRIKEAVSGNLRMRPKERPVFDPSDTSEYIPPKYVQLGKPVQNALFEKEHKKKGSSK
jgi:adenine-specific DNA-methyltransferase